MFGLKLGIATIVAFALGATIAPITASAVEVAGGDEVSGTAMLPGYQNPPGTEPRGTAVLVTRATPLGFPRGPAIRQQFISGRAPSH